MLFFRLEIFLFVKTYVDRRVGISREITWDKSSAHVFIWCYALDSNPTWTKPSSGTKNFCVQHCLGRAAPGQFMGVEEGEKVWDLSSASWGAFLWGWRGFSRLPAPLFQPPPHPSLPAAAASGPDLVPRQALCLLSAAAWAQCGAGSQEFKF